MAHAKHAMSWIVAENVLPCLHLLPDKIEEAWSQCVRIAACWALITVGATRLACIRTIGHRRLMPSVARGRERIQHMAQRVNVYHALCSYEIHATRTNPILMRH